MIATHGLTHISLAVRDPDRSLDFYSSVFGAEEYYRDDASIQAKGPGMHNIIAFERDAKHAGRGGGTLLRRGQFAPGFPFAYVADPDGYEIEIWFE
ncbi:MAG TPA: VOC family protein [Thermoanaerobaculia bacterium]|nr:VOC family protein [Thermoanaerobaculia bacterium]